MPPTNLERLAAVMPPDGTDLAEVFVTGGGFSTEGLFADDATVRFVAPSAEQTTAGPQGFLEGWADWLEAWESYRIYYEDVVDRGDRVVVLVRLRGVTKRDSVEMEQEAAGVFRFEGDRVVEIEFNLDRDDALAE
jgi:ketosteroid isomerase-like protein